jgi:ribosomal protein S18 acetylase RimI-like enzyme
MDLAPLDNIFWNALSGPQARFSEGTATARRYARGFSPILGFASPQAPDLAAIAPFCGADEHFYTDGWNGPVPAGWRLDLESTMVKMVWDATAPEDDPAPEAIALRPEHAPQALALAVLTNPGPFGIRTIELGEYFGLFEGERLVAMAGERTAAGSMREISGVCTHPDQQGRGHARRLVFKLVRRQLARGLVPFLHVMSANAAGRGLYGRLGFREYRETVVRVVTPEG